MLFDIPGISSGSNTLFLSSPRFYFVLNHDLSVYRVDPIMSQGGIIRIGEL